MSNSILPMLPDDNLTLPLLVARSFGFPLQWVERENEIYYDVVDWIKGLTRHHNGSLVWRTVRAKNKRFKALNISKLCVKVARQERNKLHDYDYTTEEGLQLITQCLRPYKGRRDLTLYIFATRQVPDRLDKLKIGDHESVYIIRCELPGHQNLYKIGRSQSPDGRLKTIIQTLPFSANVITCCKVLDAKLTEKHLHKKYAAQRVRYEWFALRDEDLADAVNFIYQQAHASGAPFIIDLATNQPLLK